MEPKITGLPPQSDPALPTLTYAEEVERCAQMRDKYALDKAALNKAVKYDNGKRRFALVPVKALEELARLYTFGANKYADHNWRLGLKYQRCADALLRHFYAWLDGEDIDSESGLHHMSAVAFYAFAVMEYHFSGRAKELDDRYKGGNG